MMKYKWKSDWELDLPLIYIWLSKVHVYWLFTWKPHEDLANPPPPPPQIVLIIESKVVDKCWAQSPTSFKQMSYRVSYLITNLTTNHSNIDV